MKTQYLESDLGELEAQLQALPDEIALSSRARARIRTQVMAHAYQGRPADVTFWDRVTATFRPRMVTRPVGAAFSVAAAIALAGSTTVSAAMESLPGDGLYPVKTAYERSCLVLAGSEENQAQCHLWMASSRINEIERAADVGRLDAVEKSYESYGVSVGVALTLAANSKQPEKIQDQFNTVQSNLKEVYEKASDAVKPLLPIALATSAPFAASSATISNTETPTQPVPESRPAQPPGDPAFIDEGPAVAAAPGGSLWIQDKTGATGEAATGKDLPISTPPLGAQPLDPAPAKNNPGPATAPLPTKNDAATVAEPEKNEPETATTPAPGPSKEGPSASESPIPSKEPSTPQAPAPEGKPSIVVQGQGISIPINP